MNEPSFRMTDNDYVKLRNLLADYLHVRDVMDEDEGQMFDGIDRLVCGGHEPRLSAGV